MTTDLVKSGETGLMQAFNPGFRGQLTSFDVSTEAGRVRAYNMKNGGDFPDPANGVPAFRLQDWMIYRHNDINEETGEDREYPLLILQTDAGKNVRISSHVCIKQFEGLMRDMGDLIQSGKVQLCVKAERSKKQGRTFHYLEAVIGGISEPTK